MLDYQKIMKKKKDLQMESYHPEVVEWFRSITSELNVEFNFLGAICIIKMKETMDAEFQMIGNSEGTRSQL